MKWAWRPVRSQERRGRDVEVQGGATAPPSPSMRRPPTSCCLPPRTGVSTRLLPIKPAGRTRLRRAGARLDRPRRRRRHRRAAARRGSAARLLRRRLPMAAASSCSMRRTSVAETRKGKTVMTPRAGATAASSSARSRPATTMSRRSATTGGCWSSRSPSCPSWAAARACSSSAIRDGGLADARTFACSRTGSAGRWAATAGGRGPRRTSNPWRAARGRGGADAAQRLPARQPVLTGADLIVKPLLYRLR